MAKKKKQNSEKKAALQAKKEAKQEKKAQKRIAKQQKKKSGDSENANASIPESIDEVIRTYQRHDEKVAVIGKTTIEDLETTFPLPRANATFAYGTDERGKGKNHLYLFGGEYFDGISNIVLDELLRFEIQKREWKRILTTSPRPSARCAHSCVSHNSCLYVFGGELANSDEYHHYRDLWKFDLSTLVWSEIKARNPPSARSGMGCLVWRHYMVIFGGFFEAAHETKWYNDVHVFNLQTETWMEVPQSRLAAKPEPRSACNIALYGTDKLIVHGGFSKIKTSNATVETKTHTDAWILLLSPLLQNKTPTWERWISSTNKKSANTPNGRAGMSSISYKNRMLVFGGVVDREEHHHKVESVFYNDLMIMDIERRKWFPIYVNKVRNTGTNKNDISRLHQKDSNSNDGKEGKVEIEVDEDSSGSSDREEDIIVEEYDGTPHNSGWDINKLRSNMFAFVDGNGNIIYERIEEDVETSPIENHCLEAMGDSERDGVGQEEFEEEKEDTQNEERKEEESKTEDNICDESKSHCSITKYYRPKKITSSTAMSMNPTDNTPEVVEREDPLPRINAAALIHGNTLFVLGGILEVGDREITLDDMWTLDLRKRNKWECLWQGTMHKQVWRGAVHDDDDSYVSANGSINEDDNSSSEDDGDGKDLKESRRSSIRQEVDELNRKCNLGDFERTPRARESLADFYSRTSDFWNGQATKLFTGFDSELQTNKELKRQGFILAKDRFEDLVPVMKRLEELGIDSIDNRDEKKEKEKERKKKRSKK